jgi:hypothetical protein
MADSGETAASTASWSNTGSEATGFDDTVGAVNRRPKLSIVAPDASPEEVVAVAAALEQFMRATAPLPAPPAPPANPWHQAALREAVMRDPRPDLGPWL